MKKKYIPEPRSKFLKVTCECGNVQEVFSHATTVVECRVCGKTLAKPSSGRTKLNAEVIDVFDQ